MILVYFIGGPEDGEKQLVDASREHVWFAEEADWTIRPEDPTASFKVTSHRYDILYYQAKNRWNSGIYYGFHESLGSDGAKFDAMKRRRLI